MQSALISRLGIRMSSLIGRFRNNPWKTVVAVTTVAVIGVVVLTGGTAVEEQAMETSVPNVTLRSVDILGRDDAPISLLGEVRSVSQAELRTQKAGEVTRVYTTAGTSVRAGTILAEINAAAERAGVLSAQGALAGAQAQLDKILVGARSEDKYTATAQADSAVISLSAAQESSRSAYVQAYALASDAVLAQADDYFTNVYTVRPSFRISSATYDEKRSLENERVVIGSLLETWGTKTKTTLAANELDTALTEAQQTLDRIAVFINTISTYISEQKTSGDYLTTSDKAAQEAQLAGARASIGTARSAVTGARQALANAESAQVTASFAESKLVVGARPEDVAAAEATVTQARGALAAAQASLERALIRTPISGSVTTLDVSVGDFVSAFQTVAVVANPQALEIEAYVSASALSRIEVGMPVRVAGQYDGTVTSRAPGLDPDTKKARITVGVPENAQLVNGSFVALSLSQGEDTTHDILERGFMIPISAIKVLPRGFAVFTVQNNVLVAIPIEEGPIVGDAMLVRNGLTPELLLVTDVRGLSEGDTVTLEQ